MIVYKNECCDCVVPAYPCMGSDCPKRNVLHLYCDVCGDEADKLYKVDGEEICEDCLSRRFEVIEL